MSSSSSGSSIPAPHAQSASHGDKKLPQAPQTRISWQRPENIAEEDMNGGGQFPSSSRGSLGGQDHSPTFEPGVPPPHAPHMAQAPSKMSYDASNSSHSDTYMPQRFKGFESGPSNGQHLHNGMPSSYPPPTLKHPGFAQQRRESASSYDAHYPSTYTNNPNPSVISHGSANGMYAPDPGERQLQPNRDPHQYNQQSSPTMAARPHAPSISGGPHRSDLALYFFRQFGHNSMILYTFDNRPQYHIEVTTNCFNPTSFITTICRGSANGEFVASFEYVASCRAVCI